MQIERFHDRPIGNISLEILDILTIQRFCLYLKVKIIDFTITTLFFVKNIIISVLLKRAPRKHYRQ